MAKRRKTDGPESPAIAADSYTGYDEFSAETPEYVAALGVLAEFESLLAAGTPVTPEYLRKATDTLRCALEPKTS